jgi:hypothetical protein
MEEYKRLELNPYDGIAHLWDEHLSRLTEHQRNEVLSDYTKGKEEFEKFCEEMKSRR